MEPGEAGRSGPHSVCGPRVSVPPQLCVTYDALAATPPGEDVRGGKRRARDASGLLSQTYAASQATGILTIPEACSQEPSWQHDAAVTAREGGHRNLNIPRLGLPTWSQVLLEHCELHWGFAERRCHASAVRLEPSVVVGRIQKGISSASDILSSFPHRSEVTEAQCRPSCSQTAARRGSIDGPKDYLEPCRFILPSLVALLRFCTCPLPRW